MRLSVNTILSAGFCAVLPLCLSIWGLSVLPAQAQTSECELVLMPNGGAASEGQFSDASAFLDSVYDDAAAPITAVAGLPVRAVMCRRSDIIPTLRDYPILKTGAVLSISQDFDSKDSGLLLIFDAGGEYKAEYSGPPLTPDSETKLRNALEIFNLQKLAE